MDADVPDREHGLEEAVARQHFARLIALHPTLIEDDRFRSFVESLNPKFKLPSRLATEEMCDSIFDEARMDMHSKLSNSHGKVTLAVGTTKSIHGEVLYTACHFIDDEWELHNMILDAYLVTPFPIFYGPLLGVPEASPDDDGLSLHGGLAVADMLRRILECGISDRLFAVVWAQPKHRKMKLHLNLAVPSVEFTYHPDTMLHSIAGPPITFDSKFTVKMYEKVQDLGLTREKRQQVFSESGLDHLWAYEHHWYACYCSLEFLRRHGSCRIEGTDYSQLIELLCRVWGAMHRAIQRMSTSSSYSAQCLEELFKVREILQSELERTRGGDSYDGPSVFIHDNEGVVDVLRNAKDTLDSIMKDSYLLWSIPLVLDPRHKLAYIKFVFSRAFGSGGARYISKVTRKINTLYADYVEGDGGSGTSSAGSDGATAETPPPLAGSSADPLGLAWNEHCRSGDDGRTDDTGGRGCLDPEMELDRYLKDPRETQTENFDILGWWKVKGCKQYPTVAKMARDALAMPTSSKLSSDEMAQVISIVHGYSKKKYRQARYE